MKTKKAFTLVELMVVIAIIAILASLGVANYASAVKKGRDSKQKSDISNIHQALVLYRSDNGRYPAIADSNPSSLNVLSPDYMKTLPANQGIGGDYSYIGGNCGERGCTTFTLCTGKLEFPRGNANSSNNNNIAQCNNTDNNASCVYYCVSNP